MRHQWEIISCAQPMKWRRDEPEAATQQGRAESASIGRGASQTRRGVRDFAKKILPAHVVVSEVSKVPFCHTCFFVDPHGVAETISKVQRVRAPRANANGLSKLELQSLSPTYIARATESNTLAALHQRTQLGANGVATHRCSQPRKPAHTQRTLPNL